MKILSLVAENFKKLRVVEIKPNGEVVYITGKNAQGKTSILDAIWSALKHADHVHTQPIRTGETKARIRLDLGELVVERRFTEKGSTLSVESADGAKYGSPQKMLDSLIGALSFDPLAFARMGGREQADALRKIANVELDIDKLEALNAGDFAKRTDVNREAKVKRAQAEAMPVQPSLTLEPVDESALLTQIEQAASMNASLERSKASRARQAQEIANRREHGKRLLDRAAQLRKEAEEAEQSAFDVEAEATTMQKRIDEMPPLPEAVNVGAVRAQLEAAQATNRAIETMRRRRAVEAEAEALELQAEQLSEQMKAREQAKSSAIAAAKMPVPGLGFGAGCVTYNGVPFEQASSAEQLRVSLSIAMAANPKLRVIRIQDGSLLDEDSLAQITEMAKAGDYQVWIEKVDSAGKVGVLIEDGTVAAVDGKRTRAAA